ncbi:hypothetical protein DFJ74DRAFT_295888 [Hyaloraphidium curvatum]|nr:hypothetical protein DFJ74DRAFT_295888 [Hyaloraphidium curvatum]
MGSRSLALGSLSCSWPSTRKVPPRSVSPAKWRPPRHSAYSGRKACPFSRRRERHGGRGGQGRRGRGRGRRALRLAGAACRAGTGRFPAVRHSDPPCAGRLCAVERRAARRQRGARDRAHRRSLVSESWAPSAPATWPRKGPPPFYGLAPPSPWGCTACWPQWAQTSLNQRLMPTQWPCSCVGGA